MNNIIRNNKRIFNSSDGSLSATISILSNNVYKVTYYEIITGASGTLTLPTGATINSGEFSGANCVLSEIDGSNKPTYVTPQTAGGTPVTATLNTLTGAWVKSGITVSTNVALIYSVNITALNYQNLNNFYIIENILMSTFSQVLSSSAVSSVTSAQLAGVITDETGSGALVFGTSPTFTTDITTPKVNFLGSFNYINGSSNQTRINANYQILFATSLNTIAEFNVASANQISFTPYAGSGLARTDFVFTSASHTSQTASANIPNFKVTGSTKQWAAGTLATQYFNYFSANTVAFASASTASEVYSMFIEGSTAGTNATITNNFALGLSAGTATIKFGNVTGSTTDPAIYFNQASPSSSNYTFQVSGGFAIFNAGTNAVLRVANATKINAGSTSTAFTQGIASSGAVTTYDFTLPSNTGQTASTEAIGVKFTNATRTWAAGAITTQREFYITSPTYAFASASTITNSYGLYVEAATAGTNATITNNYAAGFSGNVEIFGNLKMNASAYGLYLNSTNGAIWFSGAIACRIIGGYFELGTSFGGISLPDTRNIKFSTSGTGSKIGTSTTEKFAFWNATPIVQPTTAVASATFVANTSGIANDTATFDGYTIGQVVKALRNAGLLA